MGLRYNLGGIRPFGEFNQSIRCNGLRILYFVEDWKKKSEGLKRAPTRREDEIISDIEIAMGRMVMRKIAKRCKIEYGEVLLYVLLIALTAISHQ